MGATPVSVPSARPSWYALETGGWRDYVTLLHLPYTAWHLSYVVIGGCLAPVVAWGRLGAAVAAFALAVGIGAHALDELRGRPLRTGIPDSVLVGLAAASIAAACGIGLVGAVTFEPWLVLLVPVGLFLVLAYNLELLGGRFHSDCGSASPGVVSRSSVATQRWRVSSASGPASQGRSPCSCRSRSARSPTTCASSGAVSQRSTASSSCATARVSD